MAYSVGGTLTSQEILDYFFLLLFPTTKEQWTAELLNPGNFLSAGGNKWIVYSATFWLFRGIFGHRSLLFPRSHYNRTIRYVNFTNLHGWLAKELFTGRQVVFFYFRLSYVRDARLVHNARLCVHGLIRCYAMLNTWKVGLPKSRLYTFQLVLTSYRFLLKYCSCFDLMPNNKLSCL